MLNNRILFLVNTPLQLVNAGIIAEEVFSTIECDVYTTSNVLKQANILCELGVFSTVYPISLVEDILPRKGNISRAVVRIKNALDLKKIMNYLPSDPSLYREVFVSGVGLRNLEYYYAINKINKDIKLSLYEEGIFEYVGFATNSFSKTLFSKLFFGTYYLQDATSLWIHKPEYVKTTWKNIELKKIPDISNTYLDKINNAFSYKERYFPTEQKCVILEQEFYSDEDNVRERKLVDCISNVIGENNIIIKLHPRSNNDKYGTAYTSLVSNVPFEIIALNEKIQDYLFVSATSSAILNLRLILGWDCRIIMLNKMFDNSPLCNDVNTLIDRIRQDSSAKKFHVPSTEDELENSIKELWRLD